MPEARFTAAAERDLLDAFLYTGRSDRSPAGAERLVRSIYAACEEQAANPMIGTARPDLGANLRVFACGTPTNPRGWVVVYRPSAEGIDVVRVFRGGRDFPNLF